MLLFSRYEYNPQTDLIGKGEFARIYRALDKDLNKHLALKIWKTGGDAAIPFIPEANRPKLISLSHPNIGSYLAIEEMEKENAFGETETIQVCAREWLDGGTLTQYCQSQKNPVILEKLLTGVVNGLSYLHRNGVAHLNIRTSNILIKETAEGPVAKITDFGAHKKPGIEGEAAYEFDFRSLGSVFYELFIGKPISYPGETEKLQQLPQPFRDFIFRRSAEPAAATPPPSSSDDTQVLISQPKSTAPPTPPAPTSSDDTQILTPKPKSTPVPAQSDDTQILGPKPKPTSTPISDQSDDTQILPPKPAASDDTQILNPKPKPTATPAASDDTRILPPRKEEVLSLFSRYEYNPTTGLIGKGGFSRVYKAFDKKLNRWVALKIYKGGEFGDRYSAIAEIRRVVNLDHSNICRYLDIEEIEKENSFGEKETTQICVMELLDGGNFAQYYNANRNDKTLKKLLNDVLNGLSYLHKNGIIHRDIKPANILIKETLDGPVAKITDFGISKISDSVNNNSSSALIVSIPYMAPEQLNVKKYGANEKISYNLDLWSLGVTIYEIVTGKVLFKNSEQDSSEQIMTNIMAPELPEKIRELSQPFRDIVAHCIVKDAKDRAQKAEELIVLLHSNYDATPVPPASAAGTAFNTTAQPESKATSDTRTIPGTKASFFVDNDKEETTSTRSVGKKKITFNPKLIGLVSFIVIFLAITFYFLTKGNKKDDLITNGVKKADSTTTAATPPVKAPAQIPAGTVGASSDNTSPKTTGTETQSASPAKTDPSATNRQLPATPSSVPNQSSTATERKPHKPAANAEEQAPPSPNSSNQKYVLILTTTQSCTVKINQEDYGKLEAGKSLKVYLVPGTYVLQATSLSNSASVYNGNLEVSEKNRSQVGQYKIPLP